MESHSHFGDAKLLNNPCLNVSDVASVLASHCGIPSHPIPSHPIPSLPIPSHGIPSHGIRPGCMSLSGSSCLQPALQAIWQKLLNYSWQFANLSWNGWLAFVFFGFDQFTSWFHCFVAAASRCSPFLCFRVPFFLFVYFSLHEMIDRQTVNPLDPVQIFGSNLSRTNGVKNRFSAKLKVGSRIL